MARTEETKCPNCGNYSRITFEKGTEPPSDSFEFDCPQCGFPLDMRLEKKGDEEVKAGK